MALSGGCNSHEEYSLLPGQLHHLLASQGQMSLALDFGFPWQVLLEIRDYLLFLPLFSIG
jgi:hypothetical protein